MLNLTPCAKFLLIVNIVVFALCAIFDSMESNLALYYIKSDMFRPYQFLTYMFVHSSLMHIFFNMFALYQFGSVIENFWGGKRFMFFYLVCGLGAAFTNMAVNYFQIMPLEQAAEVVVNSPTVDNFKAFASEHSYLFNMPKLDEVISTYKNDPEFPAFIRSAVSDVVEKYSARPVVGASGAVFGLLLAFGMMFPDLKLQFMFIPIGIKAKYFVLLYGAAELFFGIENFQGDYIAHFAHLGGMLFGFVLILYWRKNPHNEFFS